MKHSGHLRTAYLQREDYCQIELLPDSAWDWCAEKLKQSSRYRPGPQPYMSRVRPGNPHSMAELRLGSREFALVVESVMPRFERVITGSSLRPEKCCQFAAFGFSERLLLYAESTNWGEVSAAGLVLDLAETADREAAGKLLTTLSQQWPLLLVDWGWKELVRLADGQRTSGYLNERLRFFSEESQAS